MFDVAVEVAGRRWTGWSSVVVSASLRAVAATLAITGSSLPAGKLSGDEPVLVTVEGKTLFNGYLDDISLEFTDGGSLATASGRSKTADLVDSAIDRFGTFSEVTGETIIRVLRRYLTQVRPGPGFDYRALSQPAPIVPKHAPNPGETYWSAIERACKAVGIVATSSHNGDLRVFSPGRFARADVVLREGENVLSLRSNTSWGERAYRVIAEGSGDGLGDAWEQAVGLSAEALDSAVRKSRTAIVQVEGSVTRAQLEARAQWEASVRRARSSKFTAVVPGWTYGPGGEPWDIGTIVGLASPSLRFVGSLLIDSVESRMEETGLVTQLGLVSRDAYKSTPQLLAADEPTNALTTEGAPS